ncbi:P-loop containing nucleoside triphosphate hydrolase protein [Rhizoctonia solani]|nr:P-loop containing nucleoside triphosphate hydrolase protein [Rhizoctonia solani]
MSATPAGNRWAVVLSCNAVKELRKLERDQSALEIVHKKIKDLSLGQFSLDNYRVVIGSTPHVPLFRARAANNLRIIYQIDLAPDSSGTFDHQVIKIFRIAPRARINYNFWVKVSVRLKRVNPIYKTRCEYRLPAMANDKYRPAMFPHEEYGLGISNQDSGFLLHDLTFEEREEIQGITMDRFVPLNKSLFNSLAADLDMALPMVLDEHERKIVNHSGASIVIGRSGTGKTTALIYKMRTIDQANATRGNYQPAKQLFVTRSRVLAQHVEATYQGLVEFTNIALKSVDELKEMAKQSREDPDRALVEFDSEVDLRNDLPERFSELENSHFPLFISFDTLCSMLEADIRHILPGQIGSATSRTLIGFEEFLHSYWPSFRGLNHLLEPNLVYSEIIGVIKGSQAAFESKEGYLTRREYVDALSRRQYPLLADIREKVYTVFELYTKHKTSRCETDAADRSRLILRHLRQTIGESRVDYLYVDEVQDNLMIDIHLLRTLVQSADNIYWSGDSAQTVVAGSAFRINDLKAFTYRDQTNAGSQNHRKTPAQFTTFELNVNFRSLSGIVCFAGYIVQAIHNLFPESIDPMEPEKAKHYGDPPIVFTDIRNEAGYFENFLLGSSASNRVVFGAQQAILVRDAETAEQLDARLQGLCNVLPIMDSKGLEFDDVLIYNFFSQSTAPPTAWSHLLGTARGNQAPPPVLCSELKMLYVATTRARRRCWIWESDDAISQLKAQWVSRSLVRVERASQMIGRLATTSNKAQWVSKGREYFSHRLYKLAAACFRQAGQLNDAKLSTAYHLMTRARLRRLRGDNPSVRIDLIVAASELEECTQLPGIGNKANIYYHAATCYESAHELVRASAAYIHAGRHTRGVQILFDARDLNNGAKALVDNQKHLDKDFFESLREEARMHFFTRREYSQLGPLFNSAEDKIKYARDRNLKVQLKHILEEHQYYDELAVEYLDEGDLDQGVGYYVKAYRHHRTVLSIKQAVTLAIEYAESVLLVEGVYRKTSHELAKSLIRKVQPFAIKTDSESCLTVDLFYAHLCLNQVNLDMVQAWNLDNTSSRQSRNVLACYLAIKDHSWLQDDSVEVVLGYLKTWDSFVADIEKIVTDSNPSSSKLAQKLLGFSSDSSASKATTTFTVSESSLIYNRHKKSDEGEELGVPTSDINASIRAELPKRLYRLLDSVHTAALASPWVLPRRYSASPPVVKLHQDLEKLVTSTDCSRPKLQVVCKILHVLDTSTRRGMKNFPDLTIIDQLWLERTFTILCSATGEVQACSALNNLADSGIIAKCLRDWLHRDSNQLRSAQASDTSITHALLHMLTRSGMYHEFFQPSSILHVPIVLNLSSSFNSNIIQPLQTFLFGRDRSRLNQAVQLLGQVLVTESLL